MEFELNGQTYRASKLSARDQFHIVRRLVPVIGELAPVADKLKDTPLDALPAIVNAISSMTDADADYVLFGLLKAVERKQPQGLGWGVVCTGTAMMYEDINDMASMLQLAAKALQHNLAGFFNALPPALKEAHLRASGQSTG